MHTVSYVGRYVAAVLIFGAATQAVAAIEAHAGDDTKSAEDRRMAEQAVRNWDANGDKVLDVHEVLKVPGPNQVVNLWFRHDVNKDGRLTIEELVRVWAEQRGEKPHIRTRSQVNVVRLWRVDNGKQLRSIRPSSAPVETVLWWPDGRWLISGTRDGKIAVMDVLSGEIEQRFNAHSEQVRGLALSRDATTVASCSTDKSIKLWDVRLRP